MLPFLYLGESPSGSCHRHFSGDWLIPAGECELSHSDDTKGAHVLQRSSSYLGVRQHLMLMSQIQVDGYNQFNVLLVVRKLHILKRHLKTTALIYYLGDTVRKSINASAFKASLVWLSEELQEHF